MLVDVRALVSAAVTNSSRKRCPAVNTGAFIESFGMSDQSAATVCPTGAVLTPAVGVAGPAVPDAPALVAVSTARSWKV